MELKTIQIPTPLHSRLKAEAALRQIPMTELTVTAIEDYLIRTSQVHKIAS